MKKLSINISFILAFMLLFSTKAMADELQGENAVSADIATQELSNESADTTKQKKCSVLDWAARLVNSFDDIDERYIEPNHYLFTVMLQGTHTYDFFTIKSNDTNGQSMNFAPDGMFKVGPYVGWKFIFGGYTFTIGHSSYDKTKTEFDFSFYTSRLGIDLFYRRTGSDYKLRDADLGKNINTQALDRVPFDGISAGISGFNLYYIFNHRRFSYPAAFSQSTCQKISCGTWLAGIGYTRNSLDLDYDKLQTLIDQRLGENVVKLDSGLKFKSAQYYDINISAGYAYNRVFAKNFLFCVSGQMALAYKRSVGRTAGLTDDNHFSFSKLNPNVIGRIGIVYNNTVWYAGASAIVKSNYYFDSRFTTNNTFGNTNIYVGYNFGLKKRYKKQNE